MYFHYSDGLSNIEKTAANNRTCFRWRERNKLSDSRALADYDSKVYEAQKAMQEHMGEQLHSLGIPFFHLPLNKVHGSDVKLLNGRIEEGKLLELQMKMIEYLEAVYAP